MKKRNTITQANLVKEYFIAHPNTDVTHKEIVPWLMEENEKRNGRPFADPDRQIRSLAQEGYLIKKSKGVYCYNPDNIVHKDLEYFTEAQKEEIKKRDGNKCVICGRGLLDGVELHVDHIKPKDLGGEATIINGQTLCAQHNFQKKNLNQTESGKKMFIRLYEKSKAEGYKELQEFCAEVLEIYEKHDVNGHIIWER